MKQFFPRWLCLGLLLAILGGCATTRPPTAPGKANEAAWGARKATLSRLSRWNMVARAGSGGIFGWSGSLRWLQVGNRFDIRISGPLGVGAVRIAGTPSAIRVRTSRNNYETTDPERLLRRELHMSLPVSGLRYWALGLPEPQMPAHVSIDSKGLLRHMRQAGWTLTYSRYVAADGYQLPQSFTAKKGDTEVKIVVEHWQLPGHA